MTMKKFYTMRDWERDRTLKVKVGQIIVPSVYYELLCCLPPKSRGHIFQVGEADSIDRNTGNNLYKTYEHVGNDYYKYIGLKP